jgi:putative transcription factor
MCGAETASPRTAKIEGAELEVCDDCVDFGTEIRQESGGGSTTTKYSTSRSGGSSADANSSSSGGTSGRTSGGSSGGRSRGRRDPFDDMEEIDPDYDSLIREAREGAGLSREELGRQLNEKASFIRKLERGESLPNDQIRRKLERALDIDLVEGAAGDEETDWSGGGDSAGMTLGDVVERKD